MDGRKSRLSQQTTPNGLLMWTMGGQSRYHLTCQNAIAPANYAGCHFTVYGNHRNVLARARFCDWTTGQWNNLCNNVDDAERATCIADVGYVWDVIEGCSFGVNGCH